MNHKKFDFIVVGAGAAGCVLAARLSELPDVQVLLIEAGGDRQPGNEHPDISEPFPISFSNPQFSWPSLVAEVGVDPGNGKPRKSRHYLQGYGVGGGSIINGMVAFRGQPGDYDTWQELGARGWAWNDVFPYFRKMERDLDFPDSPGHGHSGPMVVRRNPSHNWGPFSKAVGTFLERRGFRYLDDYNTDFGDGFSSLPMTNLPDRRVSTVSAYLDESTRQRPNLTILPEAFVERLSISGSQVKGVVAVVNRTRMTIHGRETIVSCGGIFSPALLMRSGIGPGAALQQLGIPVVRHLPGVGQNLQNHPKIEVAAHLPRSSMQAAEQRDHGQNCLRYSSGLKGCEPHDMGLISLNRTGWHPLGKRVGAVAVALYQPMSKGTVELVSAQPDVHPRVRFNMLEDPKDFARMESGLRFGLEILADKEVRKMRNEALFAKGGIVSSLGKRSRSAWLKSLGISSLLDVAPVRRAVMSQTGIDPAKVLRNESQIRDFVAQHTTISHHVSCTCKMGDESDPDAVLDPDCRVLGVDGLRVVDASVFPRIVRAGMYLPVMMVAEKMSDRIKASL